MFSDNAPTIKIIIRAKSRSIHIGESTQSHDHEITPASFRPIKSTVNAPVNPMPEFEFFLLIVLTVLLIIRIHDPIQINPNNIRPELAAFITTRKLVL